MTTYVLAQVNVTDLDGFTEYTNQFAPTIVPFDGEVVMYSDNPEVLEGSWPEGRTVVLSFPSVEQARAWYHSEEYQRISELRRAASQGSLVIVEGV